MSAIALMPQPARSLRKLSSSAIGLVEIDCRERTVRPSKYRPPVADSAVTTSPRLTTKNRLIDTTSQTSNDIDTNHAPTAKGGLHRSRIREKTAATSTPKAPKPAIFPR